MGQNQQGGNDLLDHLNAAVIHLNTDMFMWSVQDQDNPNTQ